MTQSTNGTLLKNTNTLILFKKASGRLKDGFSDGLRLTILQQEMRNGRFVMTADGFG